MRKYIPIIKIAERDPAWADRVRARDKRKRRRHRVNPIMRANLMHKGVKAEAKRKGVEFDLTVEWFDERLRAGICELSGVGFSFERTSRGIAGANTPSVDRIIPGGNYTVSNCRMVLFSINQAMGNWGDEYFISVFEKVLARRKSGV